jgi:hypothetical protein
MQAILEHNTTHFKQYYDEIEIKQGKIFNETELDVSLLEDGEYTLYIMNNVNEIVSKELVRIGDYTNEYKKEKKFIQYVRK